MTDTHTHLDACADPADVLLDRARAAGITRVLTVGTSLDSCHAALELAVRDETVFAILGIHPHEAGGDEAGRIDELRELFREPRAVAVGETGLDYYRDYAPRDDQYRLFEQHLALAAELEKPAVIHCRAAENDVARVLTRFDGTVILHCFSAPELLRPALERGWYVSFAGNVTYPKAQELRDAAARVPSNRILAETDAPYLAPQPLRGRPNEPANVVHTLAVLAQVRDVELPELEAQIDANAAAAFSLA